MNLPVDRTGVNWLFLDLNAFFASCEQQDDPALRGEADHRHANAGRHDECYCRKLRGESLRHQDRHTRPGSETTLSIAHGRSGKHQRYSFYHERILEAVDTCIPVDKVMSIDELACRLMGREREIPVARELANKIKRTIRERVGDCLRCSIGLAPSVFLGKVASDIQKPDGLVVITPDNLPDVLLPLKLTDIYGIGSRMETRLNRAGIVSVADLWAASSTTLRRVWGRRPGSPVSSDAAWSGYSTAILGVLP